jgi:hypothetical protein
MEDSFSPLSNRGSLRKMISMLLIFGRSRMLAGRGREHRAGELGGPLQFGGYPTSAWVTCSGSMVADSCVPFVPFLQGRRQTEHAASWSTPIPCFRFPHRTEHFPFWFQPVARVSEESLRQLNSERARPNSGGGKMANSSQVLSRLNAFSIGTPQTQIAASMANPEV